MSCCKEYHDHDFDYNEHIKECLKLMDSTSSSSSSSSSSLDDINTIIQKDLHEKWNSFYNQHNTGNMYKDRTYIYKEFEEFLQTLNDNNDSDNNVILEIGSGYGSTAFPLIKQVNNIIKYIATDYSNVALDVMKNNPLYDESIIIREVWDINESLNEKSIIINYNVKIILCIFTLSAIVPSSHLKCLKNIASIMNNNTYFLFRDYAKYDSTMFRHKIKYTDNFYMRQDGTYAYYFDEDYLTSLVAAAGLTIIELKYATISSINRKKQSTLKRVFIHMVCILNI